MKGDFTRDTFDAAKHFSRVLMQQGRVQLDADWNEQTSILLHYLRTLAADILGPYAGPAGAMGFDLITKDAPNADARIDAMEPDSDRANYLKQKVADGDVVVGIGRYYVHGVLVENYRAILYSEQLGYPFSDATKLENLKDKSFIAYLDVWERLVTYVQDGRIRDVALGGPDTCTRAQVVWQLKALISSRERRAIRMRLDRGAARACDSSAAQSPCQAGQAAHGVVRDLAAVALSRRGEPTLPGGSAPGRNRHGRCDHRHLQMVARKRLGRLPDRLAQWNHRRRRDFGA